MRLKGTCKITLKDAKNGLILYQDEHSNTVTGALARIFESNLSGTMDYSKLTPLYSKLLGGVCLFDDEVDSTDVFLPSQDVANLTAHAGQTTYSSAAADTKRGIPNTTLSSQLTNGYKFVWEWTQTQGNGNIKSICLTHSDTGNYWNEAVPNTMETDFNPVGSCDVGILSTSDFELDTEVPAITGAKRIPIGFYEDINHIVSVEVDASSRRLNVYISKFTGSGLWMWNEIGEPYEETMIPFPISYPQWGTWEHLGRFCYSIAYDAEAKKIYAITVGRAVGSSETSYQDHGQVLYTDVLDIETGTVSSVTIDLSDTLGTFDILLTSWAAEGALLQLAVIDGNIFLPVFNPVDYPYKNAGMSIRVNLNNIVDLELISGLTDDFEFGGSQYSTNVQLDLGNGRIMYPNSLGCLDSSGDYQGYAINRASIFGYAGNTKRLYAAKQPSNNPIQFLTSDSTDSIRGCVINKLYQATVFTLSEVVQKTSAMTMTVEYTITQAEEEES